MYKKALIIGATSGIGYALASALVTKGTSVLIVGRRSENLQDFVNAHPSAASAGRISTFPFDITSLSSIPAFISQITTSHPDLDCVILNSGIQRAFDLTSPTGLSSTDLETFNTELTTNYIAYVHLTSALLPFLLSRNHQASLVYISATLGLVPGLLRTPGYNASKAALHTYILNLREQLRRKSLNAPAAAKQNPTPKIIEVFPPAVRTELHDTKHQPDLVNGDQIGIPLEQFTESCLAGLRQIQDGETDEEEFLVGNDGQVKWMDEMFGFEAERQIKMREMATGIEKGFKKFLRGEQQGA